MNTTENTTASKTTTTTTEVTVLGPLGRAVAFVGRMPWKTALAAGAAAAAGTFAYVRLYAAGDLEGAVESVKDGADLAAAIMR